MDHSGPTRRAMRLERRFSQAVLRALVLAAALLAGVDPTRAAGTCPDAPDMFADVADIADDLALILSDGRKIRLAGVEPPRATALAPSRPEDLRDALRAGLRGSTVGLAPLGPPDRWQAIPAIVFTDGDTLAASLLSQGKVRVQPERAAKPCRQALLQSESAGRNLSVSVWRDPALAIVDADAIAPYGAPAQESLGGFAVVEGRVASVGETPTRLYLNLGHRRGGFAISLPKRDIDLMASEAIMGARTVGARLRVRGLIDRHAGLRIDVSDADAIEILGPSSGDAASPSP